MYDPKNMFKEWYPSEPFKVNDQGNLTGEVHCVSTFGPMCSYRYCPWKFEVFRAPENPKKLTMLLYSVEKPVPDGCVAASLFKYGVYEQVGNDVVTIEA